jgi:uncharacterized membrane protein
VGSDHSLVALAYPSREAAEAALADLGRFADEHGARVKDAAVVVKAPAGRIELHQTRELSVGEGLVAGGTVGFLLGLLVGGPIGASVAGMVGGSGFGAFDTGIENKRLRALGEQLEPGQAALVALVDTQDWAALRVRLVSHQGELLLAELSDEALEALGGGPEGEPGSSGTRP